MNMLLPYTVSRIVGFIWSLPDVVDVVYTIPTRLLPNHSRMKGHLSGFVEFLFLRLFADTCGS